MRRKKIAIIGSGISGLTCAYSLAAKHDITVFEKADRPGGHTHTVNVEKDGEVSDIDTGFIVFNDRTYPNFIALLDKLGVGYQPTEMSFSVRNDAIDLEYNGNNINSLFAQRRNLVRPRFLQMIAEIVRFNREVRTAAAAFDTQTIGEFIDNSDYSPMFSENYLLPMISAIWSMGMDSCMDFPLQFFVRFFDNHGLLDLVNRPQWYTVTGGSSSYLDPLTASFKDRIRLNSPVLKVERMDENVKIVTAGEEQHFDEVIFACHGREALSLLASPTDDEKAVLHEFQSSDNDVVLHTDTSFLPKRRLGWASWNYNMTDAARSQTTLTYNMNILQRLSKAHTYLVTLNQDIETRYALGNYRYSHPVFSLGAIGAQHQWENISGQNNTHYCGAYWFNGFHEDGVNSALRVCTAIEESP